MVQPILPKQKRQFAKQREKTPPPFSVLEICKYTTEHILLMGRSRAGKSKVLKLLLLQEAEKACAESQAKTPVLIELRS